MIIRNNPKNRTLVKRMERIVNAEPGFRVSVDSDWNRGEDIRFEINAVGMDTPLVVSSHIRIDGRLELGIRLLPKRMDMADALTLAWRLNSLHNINDALDALVFAAKPEPSTFSD